MEQAVRPKSTREKPKKKETKKQENHTSGALESESRKVDNASTSTSVQQIDNELTQVREATAPPNDDTNSHSSNQDLQNAKTKHSPVVPGYFYTLCTTKPDSEAATSNIGNEMPSYTSNTTDASLQLEPSAPMEGASLESALSPTAPMLSDTSLEAGEFNFDQSYNEILKLNEETSEEENEVLPVLPVQEDEWEFSGAEQQQREKIYPALEQEDPAVVSANLEPFTQEELSMFYNNVLLDHVESHVEQFLSDAADYHDRFKTLLTAYYQARQQLIKIRQKHAQYQETVQSATQKVFQTQIGKVEAEAFCQDRRKVNTVHHYETCTYDAEASSRLGLVLREDRRIAEEEVALAGYSSTLARLHCEQFLYEVTEKHKRHRLRLQENSGKLSSSSVKSSILLELIIESVNELKAVCNVLFLFIRKRKCKDDETDRFWDDIEKWVSLIIFHLLQSSDCVTSPGRHFREEMFVLNHILRCPPGVHRWSAGLIQVSGPSFSRDGAKDPTSLDHSICLLYLMLKHPKGRDGFLAELKTTEFMSFSNENSEAWTLIDDDGDEVDSNLPSPDVAVLPLESDLITIFRQMPLEGLISSILQMTKKDDSYRYAETRIRSEDIMTTFATCDLICDILGSGLTAFGRPKYKQLVRRVAQTMRNIVLIVSQHWQQYRIIMERDKKPQRYSNERLQLEFDEFYKRSVSRLLSVAKLGIYQFVADLSYHYVSSKAADSLYLLMNVPPGVRSELDTLISKDYTKQEWLEFIQDPDTKLAFEDHLSTMPTNEIVYLLTTFANLAQARPSTERHLVTTIAVDIFKVSFIYKSTRDVCSKTGRELLSSVAAYHPFIVTTLIHFVEQNMHAVSNIAVYALSDLPFSLWQPTNDDVTILRTWILTNPAGSNQCKLAQIIVQGMNFDINTKSVSLYTPLSIHRHIALLLVEACVQIHQQQAGLMMKSLDHVTKVASSVRLTSHPAHQQFIAWSWRILFRLKLHQRLHSIPSANRSSANEASSTSQQEVTSTNETLPETVVTNPGKPLPVPNISTDSVFLPILHATKEKHAMACYVGLMMGTPGHRMDAFLSDGLDFAATLASHGQIRALLHVFDCIVPMFYDSQVNLGLNQKFNNMLTRFVHSTDEGIIAGVANFLRADNSAPESSVTLLSSIINHHVAKAKSETVGALILSYWMQVVLAIPSWYKDLHFKTLLNYIFQRAFLIAGKSLLECRTMLFDSYVNMVLHGNHDNAGAQPKGMVSSFIQMVSGGHQESPSFIGIIATSDNIYFKYESLLAETRYEDDCNLWSTILSALRTDPKLSVESAVKKSNSKLKLAHNPSHNRITLYRWAELALHTPHDHPYLPLVWYNFFLRFIYLPKDGGSSLGCRFFDPVSMLPLYNKLRLRLQASMEFHHGVISSKAVSSNNSGHHELLVKLYQSFKLWLEEPKMHESNLYLPSLPSQYNSTLLALVRTRKIEACDDMVDKPRIKKDLIALSEKWNRVQNLEKSKRRLYTRPSYHHQSSDERTQERITHLLKQFESPLPMSAKATKSWSPPATVQNSLQDCDSILTEIDQDLKIVSAFANHFTIAESKHHRINRDFLTVLPQLYFMKATELIKTVECQSAFAATHKCAGGAKIELRFKQKTLNESAFEQLQANRNLYKREIEDFASETVSIELSYASLHIECVIHVLEANLKNPTHSESLQNTVNESGIRLFYLLADMYSGERVNCLLTRKFLAKAVEMLGKIFVSQSSDEASHILQQVINNPDSATLLSPHFAPGCKSRISQSNSIGDYIDMYQRVVKLVSTTKNDNPDVLFVLLTKFEMSTWLDNFNPPLHDRVELLGHLMVGLVSCNMKLQRDADKESSNDVLGQILSHRASHATVHEVYLNHLQALLVHNFPTMFIDVLRYLLEASRTLDVSVSTWDAFLDVSFKDPFLSVVDATRSCTFCSCMNWNTLQNALETIATYFNEYRNSTAETRSSGLYVSWKPYISVLSRFFTCLGHTYLTAVCADKLPLIYTETKLTGDPNWSSIVPVCDLYAAWFQPTFMDAETRQLGWPWKEEDIEIARPLLTSFANILKEFCQRDTLPVGSYLAYIWSLYASAVMHETQKVPAYIFKAHHSILIGISWDSFVPQLSAFDQMIQLTDGRDSLPISFLCEFIPKLSWTNILERCRNPPSTPSDPQPEWSPITSEVLCRLLHLLLSLGSSVQRLEKHKELVQLFSTSEPFPWRCINPDQLDHLLHLACERYLWTSPLMYQSVKYLARDPRNCAFRLLKLVSGLPLTGEEKGNSRAPVLVSANESHDSDWQKMQVFVKTVGQLLQKMKVDDKIMNAASKPLARYVERSYESIEMSSKYRGATEQLTGLLSVLFNYLNVVPSRLQGVVCDSLCSVVSRKAICSSCASLNPDKPVARQCQDCLYLRSRALSPLTLLSSITSICDTATYAAHTSSLLEEAVISYMDISNHVTEGELLNEVSSKSWKDVLTAYSKPVAHKEEFIKHSLRQGCVVALYVFSLDMIQLGGFHVGTEFIKNELPTELRLEKLYEAAVLDVQWLTSMPPTKSNESKFLLIWDHFLCICAILFKVASLSPTQGFTVHSILDTVASLLPVLEQIGQDKVKTGILGSFGIGTQSPLSTGFRLTSKGLLVYLKHWIAKADATSDSAVTNAQNAFETFKNLPVTNGKIYLPVQPCIEAACLYLSREDVSIEGSRKYLALFVKHFFSSDKFLSHFSALS